MSQYNTANKQEGEGQVYSTSLVRHCDLVAPQVWILSTQMRKANLFNDKLKV